MKRFLFLPLLLLLILIVIPGCITVQTQTSEKIPVVGTPPVVIVFSSNPSTITPGGTPTLLWSVIGANSVSIDQGIGTVDAAGARVISPAKSTVYTLIATNSKGTITKTAVTTVNSVSLLQQSPLSSIQENNIVVGVISGESGSIIKSGQDYTKSHAVCVGDTGGSMASRAFLSFDISSIPGNAVIDEISLNLGGYTTTGNPTYTDPVNGPQYGNFGALKIERCQYGTYEDLNTNAYNKPGELVASGEITSYPLSTWNLAIMDPASGTSSVQGLVTAGQAKFQLRAQFFTSTNWDSVRDMLCFDQAKLTVKYHLP